MSKNCAVCENNLRSSIVDLPELPLTEVYTKIKPKKREGFIDQEFYYCERCGHGQLKNIIKPSILYKSSRYYFRTSESITARHANDYFLSFIERIIKGRKFKNIVEIGSSDLYLLNKLNDSGEKLLGIDPVLKGKEKKLSTGNIKIYGEFIEKVKLKKVIDVDNSLIISSHTLEHVVDPKALIKRLFSSVSQNSLFIFQFPSLDVLVKDMRYDQIFHQHLHYFSLLSFKNLLASQGGELIDFKFNYYHWGTLLVAFRKARSRNLSLNNNLKASRIKRDYLVFQQKMKMTNRYLKSLKGEKIYGFGASNMLPILSYHLKNDFSDFACILDNDKNKEGLYYINLPVCIKTPNKITDISSSNIVITAINTPRSVLSRVLSLKPKRIILPVSVL